MFKKHLNDGPTPIVDNELGFGSEADWYVSVLNGQEVAHSSIKWSKYRLPSRKIVLAQRLLKIFWSPVLANWPQKIPQSMYRKYNVVLRILLLMEEIVPGKSSVDLERADWIQILVQSISRKWNEVKSDSRFLVSTSQLQSYQVIERMLIVLREWYTAYQNGHIDEGPEFDISFTDLKSRIDKELQTRGVGYSKWRQGGTFGSVEFTVANLLLSDAISTLTSLKSQQLLAYFDFVRETNSYEHTAAFWDKSQTCQAGRYRKTGDPSVFSQSVSGRLKQNRSNLSKVNFAIPLHHKLIALTPEGEQFSFPWQTYTDLSKHYITIRTAVYVIFLSVMGKRGPSEVLTLRGVDITPPDLPSGRSALVRPSIQKTNHGVRLEQGVTNLIDLAFDVILRLGYIDKRGTTLPLFSSLPKIGSELSQQKSIRRGMQNEWLHEYYDDFCLRMSPLIDFEVKAVHSHITSHQFRHSFAEFALRRFDGNVEELLRQHFCHKYNHWWTKKYTADKLDKEYEVSLSKKYIRELIPRILGDCPIDPDFSGGMAIFIKKNFQKNWKVLEAEEIETYVENICTDILDLTPHEYGWCLVHKNYKNLAQCKDSHGNPNPSSTDSQKCNRCANFCTSKNSHLVVQRQIAINHIDFIENDTWKMPRLKEASIQAVRSAQLLYPELLELGDFQ